MVQKIIRVGNSAAITIPKEIMESLGLSIGTKAKISIRPELNQLIVDVPVTKTTRQNRHVTREFTRWLSSVLEEDKELIQELAKR